jgi:hypothetical protein
MDWGLNSGLHSWEAGTPLLEAHLQSTLVIFEIVSCVMPSFASTGILFVLPHIAGMTGVYHHTQSLVEMGRSHELFAQTGLEP